LHVFGAAVDPPAIKRPSAPRASSLAKRPPARPVVWYAHRVAPVAPSMRTAVKTKPSAALP